MGETKLSNFTGIKNTVGPESLTANDLARATNIDIDDAGKLRRRRGVTQILAGTSHSVCEWSDSQALAVVDGDLALVSSDGTKVILRSGVGTSPMYYATVAGKVYARNAATSLVIEPNLTTHDWGVPHVPSFGTMTYTSGDLTTGSYSVALTYVRISDGLEGGWSIAQGFNISAATGGIRLTDLPQLAGHTISAYVTPPNGETYYFIGSTTSSTLDIADAPSTLGSISRTLGQHPPLGTGPSAYFMGRLYLSDGNVVWVTEPYQYEAVRLSESFMQFESDITFIAPVTDGVYYGTTNEVFFVAGAYPDVKRVSVVNYGAPLQAASRIDPDYVLKADIQSNSAILVVTHQGVCVGYDSGRFTNVTNQTVWLPQAESAATLVRHQDGLNQFIGVLNHSGAPSGSARFGDYVDAEIRRFSGA